MKHTCLGYLWFRDSTATQDWVSRLCLLRQGGVLVYFDIEPNKRPKGKIPLRQAQVDPSTGPVPGSMHPPTECFECTTPNRTFHIHAETHENRNKWVKLLNDHIQKLSQEPSQLDQGAFELRDVIATAERVEFLTKSGGIKNLSWKKRLFLLSGEYFLYYELPQGLRAQGNYTCQGSKPPSEIPTELPQGVKPDFLIEIQTNQGKILVAAMGPEDKNRWVDAITTKSGPQPERKLSVTQDTRELDEIKQQIQDLTELKEKSDKIIRALKNENKKHKQSIEELNAEIQHKDKELHDLAFSLSTMREELMTVHDSR
eukprot:c13007_g1_i1.p1 GENE.c13007_g1_i1~~c13007_g1_i1.p1  ORF type:complete len:342 (-),score=89.64 c13007_g1_i1:67-1008(-)